jgi:hypothetical protein
VTGFPLLAGFLLAAVFPWIAGFPLAAGLPGPLATGFATCISLAVFLVAAVFRSGSYTAAPYGPYLPKGYRMLTEEVAVCMNWAGCREPVSENPLSTESL